jgi:integrase
MSRKYKGIYSREYKGKTTWSARIQIRGKVHVKGGFETRMDAARWRKEQMMILQSGSESQNEGVQSRSESPLFEEFLGQFYRLKAAKNNAYTVRNDRYRMRFALNYFAQNGIFRLEEITLEAVEEMLSVYKTTGVPSGQGRSDASYNLLLIQLKAIPEKAVEYGKLDKNPLRGIKKKELTIITGHFSFEEITRIINAASGWIKKMILILYYTGMRRGELHGLKWSNVDLDKGIIIIEKRKNKKPLIIPIHPSLAEYLKPLAGSPRSMLFPKIGGCGLGVDISRASVTGSALKAIYTC